MKKAVMYLATALIVAISIVAFAGCGQTEHEWLSPMISFEIDNQTASLWNSRYALHRNETFEYVFHNDGIESEINREALLAGGALPATVRLAYGGDGEYLARLVVFAYNFFDHGRPARINAHAATPNPQEILVLWQNPENGFWFNLIQDGIGRTTATQGANHDNLVSLRNGNDVYTFRFNSETVEDISELELFIIATAAPTRDDDFERSGYSLSFTIELPDMDNHFHSWEILAAAGTMLTVE